MPMIQFDLRLKSFIPIYMETSFEDALAIFSAFTCGFQITCNSFPSAVSDGRKRGKLYQKKQYHLSCYYFSCHILSPFHRLSHVISIAAFYVSEKTDSLKLRNLTKVMYTYT